MMNTYFSTIGTTLAAQISVQQIDPELDAVNIRQDIPAISSISTMEIQASPVKRKMSTLKVNKATGPDNIHPRLLKLAGETIIPLLAALFAQSLNTSTVFTEWKMAKLTAVYKKDDRPTGLIIGPYLY